MNSKYSIPSLKSILGSNEYKFSAVSLFAGGGGSSTGYRMAGGNILAANEFVPEAVATYKANYPNTNIFEEDIRTLSNEKILNDIGVISGDLDLLDGSPPCSAFSSLGKKDNGWGKEKAYSDLRQTNVEDLFFEYIRVLRCLKPRVFVAENVVGLTTGSARGYLNEILKELRSSGYYVEVKIIDAQYLGVPQRRNRVIFVGIRTDLMQENYKSKMHPAPFNFRISCSQAFEGLEFTENDRADTDLTRYSVYKKMLSLKDGERHKKNFSLAKLSRGLPSPCLTATNGDNSTYSTVHWDNRALTVSEFKRLMSVPDDYVLTGSYAQKKERLGRMVPPLMMKAIAENIVSLGVFNGKK